MPANFDDVLTIDEHGCLTPAGPLELEPGDEVLRLDAWIIQKSDACMAFVLGPINGEKWTMNPDPPHRSLWRPVPARPGTRDGVDGLEKSRRKDSCVSVDGGYPAEVARLWKGAKAQATHRRPKNADQAIAGCAVASIIGHYTMLGVPHDGARSRSCGARRSDRLHQPPAGRAEGPVAVLKASGRENQVVPTNRPNEIAIEFLHGIERLPLFDEQPLFDPCFISNPTATVRRS
jgi:hypothetical protein